MSISQWSVDDRPREKLLAKGPKALTNTELLAIFLRVGRKGVNSNQMAQELNKKGYRGSEILKFYMAEMERLGHKWPYKYKIN